MVQLVLALIAPYLVLACPFLLKRYLLKNADVFNGKEG